MVKNIVQLLQSGLSRRWHNNPDMADKADDLAQHQWHVAMIVLFLKPDASRELLIEAITHDVGEMVVGDLSYDFKINNFDIASLHKEKELSAKQQIIENGNLSKEETQALKFADWLSSYWWVALKNRDLVARADWRQQRQFFVDLCEKVPFGVKARFLISKIDIMSNSGTTEKIDLNWRFDKGFKEYEVA